MVKMAELYDEVCDNCDECYEYGCSCKHPKGCTTCQRQGCMCDGPEPDGPEWEAEFTPERDANE
jgi:hypothetical protein